MDGLSRRLHVALASSIILTVLLRLTTAESEDSRRIPQIIWSYWSDQNLPAESLLAIASWKKFAPQHEIRFLNSTTWRDYMSEQEQGACRYNATAKTNHFSDWLRVYLVQRYGGIWMDSSLILTNHLDKLVNDSADVSGFQIDGLSFETSFIASAPGAPVTVAWRREYERFCNLAEHDKKAWEQYLFNLKLSGIEPLNGMWADCWWGHGSLPREALHWFFQRVFVKAVNLFMRYTGFVLHPCGELYWCDYLRLNVAFNVVVRTTGADPRELWARNSVSAQDTLKTLSATSYMHGWDHVKWADFMTTEKSAGYDLDAALGLKLRRPDRTQLQTISSCHPKSALCRIQRLAGVSLMPEQKLDGDEMEPTEMIVDRLEV
eukprot:TRINITY_DN61991_c0_g1_i1.p1 TRINITY_DN61991_c0_g1~~TRINITY_DN61991_c0_g1_i1.p1  ORF type:complete len:376 (-),score=27.60 TRINITY_DN61991_c0_g1_i1:369-1496(-)